MSTPTKIFGREPAFYVGLVEAILTLLLSFQLFNLSQATAAVIVAFVTAALGFYTAYVTRDTLLGVGTGLAKSTVALFVAFGLHLTDAQTAGIIALAVFVLGAFQRTQTGPAQIPSLDPSGRSYLAS